MCLPGSLFAHLDHPQLLHAGHDVPQELIGAGHATLSCEPATPEKDAVHPLCTVGAGGAWRSFQHTRQNIGQTIVACV